MLIVTLSLDFLGDNATMYDLNDFAEFVCENIQQPVDQIDVSRTAASLVSGVTEEEREVIRVELDRLWNLWLSHIESGDLMDYQTGEVIRAASEAEHRASIAAARTDGGAGVILVNGRSCYVG